MSPPNDGDNRDNNRENIANFPLLFRLSVVVSIVAIVWIDKQNRVIVIITFIITFIVTLIVTFIIIVVVVFAVIAAGILVIRVRRHETVDETDNVFEKTAAVGVRRDLAHEKVASWKLKRSGVAEGDLAVAQCGDFVAVQHTKDVPHNKRREGHVGVEGAAIRETPAVKAKEVEAEKVETSKVGE